MVEYGGFGSSAGNLNATCTASGIPTVTISNSNLDNSAGYGMFVGTSCNFVIGDNVTFMNNAEGDSNVAL